MKVLYEKAYLEENDYQTVYKKSVWECRVFKATGSSAKAQQQPKGGGAVTEVRKAAEANSEKKRVVISKRKSRLVTRK